jgi:hypothetical protein
MKNLREGKRPDDYTAFRQSPAPFPVNQSTQTTGPSKCCDGGNTERLIVYFERESQLAATWLATVTARHRQDLGVKNTDALIGKEWCPYNRIFGGTLISKN